MKRIFCLIILITIIASHTYTNDFVKIDSTRQERIKNVIKMVDDYKQRDPLLKAIQDRNVKKVKNKIKNSNLYESCTFWVSPRLKINTTNIYLLYAMFSTLLDKDQKDKENILKIINELVQKKPDLNSTNKLIIKLGEKEYESNVGLLHFVILFELYPDVLEILIDNGAKLTNAHIKNCKCNGIAKGINEYYNAFTIYLARIYAKYAGLERFMKLHDFACTNMPLDEFAKNLQSPQYLPIIQKYMPKKASS